MGKRSGSTEVAVAVSARSIICRFGIGLGLGVGLVCYSIFDSLLYIW